MMLTERVCENLENYKLFRIISEGLEEKHHVSQCGGAIGEFSSSGHQIKSF